MSDRNHPRHIRYLVGAIAAVAILVLTTTTSAQIFPTPTPTPPRRTAPPTPPPSAQPTPQPTVVPEEDTPIPLPTDEPDDTPKPGATTSAVPEGDGGSKDDLPDELEKRTLVVPVIPRTRPRNTGRLVSLLEPLTDYGLTLEQVLIEGMGRFPVAGVAYYRDDWLHPRYNPEPHLHHGLDIFTDFGTPIRSPDRGYVSQFLNDPARGGLGVKVRGSDGTTYYFAHLAERAPGLFVGQRVNVGTVVGFAGDSGNAQGGAPHLHFEIRRPGAIPPKPSVDKWLDEAIDLAPKWVEARRKEIESKRDLLGGRPAPGGQTRPSADLDASMLLTLLDPVGGSVGLLPRLELATAYRARVSSGLLAELIRLRLDGYLFAPSSHGLNLRD